jgi:long-chain acyl-CoA synthetase
MQIRIAKFLGDAAHAALRPIRGKLPRQAIAHRAGPSPHPWLASYPAGIDWAAKIEPKPLTRLLDDAVAAHARETCIRFRGRSFRYAEIGDLVERAARGFRALGVHRGIKVALMLPNCPYAVICFYAVLKAGGTVVNVNPLYARREIARLVDDAGACILVTLDMGTLYGKVEPLLTQGNCLEKIVVCNMADILPFREKAFFSLLRRREIAVVRKDEDIVAFDRLMEIGEPFARVECNPADEVAVYQYTGGTTGFPKAARLTHANLYANALQLAMWRPVADRKQEIILGVLPLFHAFGMTAVMNLALAIGARMVLLPHFKLSEVLKTIDRERPNVFIGVPTMFSAINEARDLAKHDLSSLEYCVSGGAPLPIGVQRRFEELSGCKLAEGYGLSEAGPVCTVNPLSGRNKPGSVGLPLPGTVVEIVDLDRPDRLLPIGERGEVCISGPQVMAGYADRARENVDVFRGGRLHTGDVGYIDADGYVHIVDRIKELILTGGFNVYPRLVEEAMCLHPAVEEAAVCGIPNSHRGETVIGFVRLTAGQSVTAVELRAFLQDHLAPFEIPRRIEFRSNLPRTFIGKVAKKDLVAELAARTSAATNRRADDPDRPPTRENAS